jgi:tRNA 5-methylaminomethyl-2-thiouridine biosynthesis bifunctional protein
MMMSPIIVVGAGLAGASTAYYLAQSGHEVIVLERAVEVASGASGNPQGMLFARLAANDTPLNQLIAHGYRHTLQLLTQLTDAHHLSVSDYALCGLLQLDWHNQPSSSHTKRQQKLLAAQHAGQFADLFTHETFQAVDAAAASALSGVSLQYGGLYFPQGGWVHSPALVCALLAHPQIQVHRYHHVQAIECVTKDASSPSPTWQVNTSHGAFNAEHVVLALGADWSWDAALRQHLIDLPVHSVRGQISAITATSRSRVLRTVLCTEGYLAPAWQNPLASVGNESLTHCLGASFSHAPSTDENRLMPSMAEHQHNWQHVRYMMDPAQLDWHDAMQLTGRVSYRCTLPDRLPVAGQLRQGLWINMAHGSRGLISAPYVSQRLAETMTYFNLSSSAPTTGLWQAMSPQRFIHKNKNT